MINYSRVAACLQNLVGFRSSDSSCATAITPSLNVCDSGRYVTSLPGITPLMIEDAIPADYSNINSYLTAVMAEEPINAMKDFIKRHKEFTMARHFLDNLDIVKHLQYINDVVNKGGRFVGIMLQPKESDNMATWIRAIGVQFVQLNPNLKLYLYCSSSKVPLATVTLSGHTQQVSLQWFDWSANNWAVNYKSMFTSAGAKFFIGYYENDLIGQACDTKMFIACCGLEQWWGDYQSKCGIQGVVFQPSALNGTDLPDMKQIGYTNQTFGLHFKLSITCDISDTICQNRMMFDSIIQKKVGMRIYADFLNTNRQNRNSMISRDMAAYNLEKLGEDYTDDLKSIQFDFSGIDRFCMPCQQKGITVSTQY